jgi:hypothetical protein
VENKTDYAACLTNAVHFLFAYIYKMNFKQCFLCALAYANVGLLKVLT